MALGIWQLFPEFCLISDQRDFVMNSCSGYTYNLCVEGVTDIIVSVFYVFRVSLQGLVPGGGSRV